MSYTTFYVQKEAGILSVQEAAVMEAISEHNWLHPQKKISVVLLGGYDAETVPIENGLCIPCGSVEFVNKFLAAHYNTEISKLFIPDELMKYAGRGIKIIQSKQELGSAIWELCGAFVKSASVLKCDYAGIYKSVDTLPDDTAYWLSEIVDIVSEWRVFVHRGIIRDIRNYSGDCWLMPDKDTVERMVQDYTSSPPAYTLDVAIGRFLKEAILRTLGQPSPAFA